ncbi:YesL family protein [Promicromonospora sp. NPDC050880]|uniref:YesL family protein n=1 Tax=Promicromonospora sp. NPDC050880 TaxID=3364406 RepID=UPI0037AA08C7
MIDRLVTLHTHVGTWGWRLLTLHLLWLLHTVRGGVVLGVFPATAAVHEVLRHDLMSDDIAERQGLLAEFDAAWRANLRGANVLGYALTLLWAVLLVERQLLAGVGSGLAGAAGSLLWFAAAFLAVATAQVWPLAAHYDEAPLRHLRRAATLVLARPVTALGTASAGGVILAAYYLVPGLVPVLGVAAPALATTFCLRRSGILPTPATPHGRTAAPHDLTKESTV